MSKRNVFDKVRYYLGDNYYLNQELDWDEEKKEVYTKTWKLFLKYDGYMEDGSSPIMTNENNKEKELLKFAKENRIYKIDKIYSVTAIIMAWSMFFVTIINCFFKIKELRLFVLGVDFSIILSSIIVFIFLNKNDKAMQKYFKRRWELINETRNIRRNK